MIRKTKTVSAIISLLFFINFFEEDSE